MARQPRIEYEGAIYHVMNRGDRREEIVRGEEDRELFVATLEEVSVKCGWDVHAWCLMGNHFHLVVETPLGNLVAGMKWFLGTYTIRCNSRHRTTGHLFSGRYKALIVDDRDPRYLRTVGDYVHLNPSRAGLIRPDEALSEYRWSSYGDYLRKPTERPKWLRVDRILGEHGIRKDDDHGRRIFGQGMEKLRQNEDDEGQYAEIRRGWRFGSEEFVSRMLERASEVVGNGDIHSRREVKESMDQRAQRIVAEELKEAGWSAGQLKFERKGHPVKVKIARRLRKETTKTLRSIAEELHMGAWTHVSHLLYRLNEED